MFFCSTFYEGDMVCSACDILCLSCYVVSAGSLPREDEKSERCCSLPACFIRYFFTFSKKVNDTWRPSGIGQQQHELLELISEIFNGDYISLSFHHFNLSRSRTWKTKRIFIHWLRCHTNIKRDLLFLLASFFYNRDCFCFFSSLVRTRNNVKDKQGTLLYTYLSKLSRFLYIFRIFFSSPSGAVNLEILIPAAPLITVPSVMKQPIRLRTLLGFPEFSEYYKENYLLPISFVAFYVRLHEFEIGW